MFAVIILNSQISKTTLYAQFMPKQTTFLIV